MHAWVAANDKGDCSETQQPFGQSLSCLHSEPQWLTALLSIASSVQTPQQLVKRSHTAPVARHDIPLPPPAAVLPPPAAVLPPPAAVLPPPAAVLPPPAAVLP